MPSRSRAVAVLSLSIAAAGGLVVWALWPSAASTTAAGGHDPGPDDDPAPPDERGDAGFRDRATNFLVAGPAELYLAIAQERRVIAVSKAGPETRDAETNRLVGGIALDGTATAMAFGETALCVAVSHDDGRAELVALALDSGAPTEVASGLSAVPAIACDGRFIVAVVVDRSAPGPLPHSAIVRFPLHRDAGIDGRVELASADGAITSLALDADLLYWADPLEGSISSVPVAGGEPRVLASERGLPRSVVVSGDALFWVEQRTESLWTMPKGGGPVRRIAQDFAGFSHLVASARGVFWTNEAAAGGGYAVLTAPKTGGDVAAVTATVGAIDGLATDGERVFWARGTLVADVPDSADAGR